MLEFTVRVFPQRVAINGELDIATAPQVESAFASLTGDVDVDCTDLSFIASSGFSSLDHGYEAAMTRGSTFKVSGPNAFAARIAELLAVPYFSGPAPRAV